MKPINTARGLALLLGLAFAVPSLAALPPVAVLCGGLLRLYQMGIRW